LESTEPQGLKTVPLTIDQVRAFQAVVEHKSWTAAASELRINDPVGVMRLLRRLARALGQPALVRTKDGQVLLTEAGKDVEAQLHAVYIAVRDLAQTPLYARFSAYPSIASRLLTSSPGLLAPDSGVRVVDVADVSRTGGGRRLLDALRRFDLDIVVAPSGRAGADLEEAPLYDWQLCLVMCDKHGDLLGREVLRPRDLKDFGVLAAPHGHRSRELLDEAMGGVATPSIVLESTDPIALANIATARERLVAVVPSDSVPAPDAGPWPQLAGAAGPCGGKYSLYRRKAVSTERKTAREKLVERAFAKIAASFVE
jgi:DNA-binding transcriptional LysR family regulator